MRLSYSKLSLFERCPSNFFYKYLCDDSENNETEMKYINFGLTVHEVLEEMDNNNLNKLISNKFIKYELHKYGYKLNDVKREVNYVISQNLNIKEREQELNIKYRGYDVIGIIDAVLDDNTIVDYKTSKFNIKKKNDYMKQVRFYAFLYYKKYGIIPPYVSIIFTKGHTFKEPITMIDINKAEKWFNDIIDKIELSKSKNSFDKTKKYCGWCEYRNHCFKTEYKENNKIVTITLKLKGNRLYIDAPNNILKVINKVFEKELSYKEDGAYYKIKIMKQRGLDYDGVKKLYMSYKSPYTYLGFYNYIKTRLNDLIKKLENKGIKAVVQTIDYREFPNVSAGVNLDKLNGIELRDYQKECIEQMIKEKISIMELSVGSGKTAMSAEIIRRLNYKTLFVVDVKDLLNQTVEEFENLLNIKCGIITNGEQEWSGVNVATIQTISKLLKEKNKIFIKNLHECNLVIVDEAHGAKSNQYNTLMENIKAEYRLGLSGTPYSNGNDSLELYKSFGFVSKSIKLKDLINMGYATNPVIKFIKYKSDTYYYGDYEKEYMQSLKDENRLKLITNIITKHKNDSILIITRRLEHADVVKEYIKSELNIDVEVIKGNLTKSKRKRYLKEMKEGKRKILIGSAQIVQKGLNIPILNVLINYSANKGKNQTIQMLGRITRKYEGKDKAYFYDFYDKSEYLKEASKNRIKVFKEEGFNVLETTL